MNNEFDNDETGIQIAKDFEKVAELVKPSGKLESRIQSLGEPEESVADQESGEPLNTAISSKRARYLAGVAAAIILFGVGLQVFSRDKDNPKISNIEFASDSSSDTAKPKGIPSTSPNSDTKEPAISGNSTIVPLPETEFFEDFSVPNSLEAKFDFDITHRDDVLITVTEWDGDYAETGSSNQCGDIDTSRTISRGSQAAPKGNTWIYNSDWIYQCASIDQNNDGRLLTSIGDTSGFSIGAFSPKQDFVDVKEVRWKVNQTDLGARQWTDVKIIPTSNTELQNLPCSACNIGSSYSETGAIGTHWAGGTKGTRQIHTSDEIFWESFSEKGWHCSKCDGNGLDMDFGSDFSKNDPALRSKDSLRENYFRDNDDGTLTWGIELEDSIFQELTIPGEFPSGSVRIVFAEYNFTPNKGGVPMGHTWHWDDISIR